MHLRDQLISLTGTFVFGGIAFLPSEIFLGKPRFNLLSSCQLGYIFSCSISTNFSGEMLPLISQFDKAFYFIIRRSGFVQLSPNKNICCSIIVEITKV